MLMMGDQMEPFSGKSKRGGREKRSIALTSREQLCVKLAKTFILTEWLVMIENGGEGAKKNLKMVQRKFAAGVPAGGRQDNQSSSHLFAIDWPPSAFNIVQQCNTCLV